MRRVIPAVDRMKPAQAMRLFHYKKTCSAVILVVALLTCAQLLGRLVGTIPSISAGAAHDSEEWIVRRPPPRRDPRQSPARELIERIREAATRLATGPEPSSDEPIREWTRSNPCRSRMELLPMYDVRRHVRKLPPNPMWDELIAEYSKLHRACLRRIGDPTHHFLHGSATQGCQFLVADVAPKTGLGNKVLVVASSILYAVLTGRVVLVPTDTAIPAITCEPFPGSSWALDSDAFPLPRFRKKHEFKHSEWTHDREFFSRIDDKMGAMNRTLRDGFAGGLVVPAAPLERAVAVLSHEWQPDNRFYCAAEQKFYAQATWVYLSGCISTIPKLFAAPAFRPTLEDLFPDKMVVTRVLRSAFLPADGIWARARRIDRAYFAAADRRVGIQVRYKDGEAQYQRMNDVVNDRVTDCMESHGILPPVGRNGSDSATVAKPVVTVFVASLFSGLVDHLSRAYVRYPTTREEDVALVQISHDMVQVMDDLEEDRQALAEVLLLSLSDQLLVTPLSTFGGLAQAYGALTPWFIEMREHGALPSCGRGQTVDVCDQFTDKKLKCPHDVPALDGELFAEVVPYVKDCLAIDHAEGIQLITDFHS